MDTQKRSLPYWTLLAWWVGGALLVWLASTIHYAVNGADCYGLGFGCTLGPTYLAAGIFVISLPLVLALAIMAGLWSRHLRNTGRTSNGPVRMALFVPPVLLGVFGFGVWIL